LKELWNYASSSYYHWSLTYKNQLCRVIYKYIVGHKYASSLLYQCIVFIRWILIIFGCEYVKLILWNVNYLKTWKAFELVIYIGIVDCWAVNFCHCSCTYSMVPRSSEWSPPFRLFSQNHVCIYLQHAYYMLCQSCPWFDYPNNIWWRVQTIEPLIMQFSPPSYYFIPILGPNALLNTMFSNTVRNFIVLLCVNANSPYSSYSLQHVSEVFQMSWVICHWKLLTVVFNLSHICGGIIP
jgi:hypothetical protein